MNNYSRTALGVIVLTGVFLFWTAEGWAAQSTVERESSLEDCFTVAAGTQLTWKWSADEPLDFNIHYHSGGKTVYPVKEPGVTSGEGALNFEQRQKLCLMWRNGELSDIGLRWTREPPPE